MRAGPESLAAPGQVKQDLQIAERGVGETLGLFLQVREAQSSMPRVWSSSQ